MPGIGGRLGWNEPPPAADHDDLDLEHFAAIGGDAEQRVSDLLDRSRPSPADGRSEPNGLICASRRFDVALRGDVRHAWDVVDRLLRIKLRALAADLVEDVDEMRLHVEQAELKHCEQPDRGRRR